MHKSKDGGNSTSGMMEEVSTPLNEACQALGKLLHMYNRIAENLAGN